MFSSYTRQIQRNIITLMHMGMAGVALFCGLGAASAQNVKLSWSPNPESNIAGYIVYYGTESGGLSETIDVGKQTTTTLVALPLGVTHYAAVQAYNTLGEYSDLSAVISFVPRIKPPTLVKNQYGATQPDTGNTLDFGMVRLGAIGETRSFTVTNTGTTTLTGLRFNIDGALTGNFLVTGMPVKPFLISNGSFEQGLDNWISSGSVVSNNFRSDAKDPNFAWFSGGNKPNNGVLSQSIPTTPGVTYQLAFDMGLISFEHASQKLRTTIRGQQTLVSNDFTIIDPSENTLLWIPRTLDFTADSTSTTITFADVSSTTYALDLLIDNVRVTDPTPPPAATGSQITTLAPGRSATFTVTFKPTETGARASVLSLVADNVPVALYEVQLAGAGSALFDTWLAAGGIQGGATGNPDNDALNNLQEYAFGTSAKSHVSEAVAVGSGQLVARGTPSVIAPNPDPELEFGGFQGIFARRKDHASVNLRYKPQFSADLIHWVNATGLPEAIGNDGEMEVVSITAPETIHGMPTRFFRVGVDQPGTLDFPQWLADYEAGAADGNPDGDVLNNFQEFAFGTDPWIIQANTAAENSGSLASRGAPSARVRGSFGEPDFEFNGLFCRRKDRLVTGISYKPQFSADLLTWQDAADTPVVLADDGEIEVVSVLAPASIDGLVPSFFRVGVEYRP